MTDFLLGLGFIWVGAGAIGWIEFIPIEACCGTVWIFFLL